MEEERGNSVEVVAAVRRVRVRFRSDSSNGCHLLSTYYAPGSVLGTLHVPCGPFEETERPHPAPKLHS